MTWLFRAPDTPWSEFTDKWANSSGDGSGLIPTCVAVLSRLLFLFHGGVVESWLLLAG